MSLVAKAFELGDVVTDGSKEGAISELLSTQCVFLVEEDGVVTEHIDFYVNLKVKKDGL
jgi:hypothetical protein